MARVLIGQSRLRHRGFAGASRAEGGSLSRRLSGLALWPLVVVGAVMILTGCGEPPDPVDEIRSLVPKIQEALNARDIGGLRRLGTGNLAANRFIIDAFEGGGEGRITLRFKRVSLRPEDTELNLLAHLDTATDPDEERTLTIFLEGNGRWRIDSYRFGSTSDGDTLTDTLIRGGT